VSAIVVAVVVAFFAFLIRSAGRTAARVLGRQVLIYSNVW
jgi:hypothetical protein